MYPLPNECPVCSGELLITSMECRHCETSIHGRFITGPFASLSLDHLEFIELFVRNEGKITRMEGDLSLSYPTIRNRLHEVIRAMGYEPGQEDAGLTEIQRKQILEELEQGSIDSQQAMRKLKESEDSD